jgi:hypothetical protein
MFDPEELVKDKMATPGSVYLLLNPALPNLVKIGKTQGTAEERARQLSGTAIPASFVVVYKKDFNDCDAAERFVHTLLETRGYRVAANREFFHAPVPVAIEAILAAHTHFSTRDTSQDSHKSTAQNLHGESTWRPLIDAAEAARLGLDGEIQDDARAVRLYEQAAKLGAPDAYIALAELNCYGICGRTDTAKAIAWLREGAQQGAVWCWAALADVYSGKTLGSDLNQPANARKCFRKFFASMDFSTLDDSPYESQQRVAFCRLKEYVDLAVKKRDWESPEDLMVILAAGENLSRVTNVVVDDIERTARIRQIEDLTECAKTALLP